MQARKAEILQKLREMERENRALIEKLTDEVLLTDYAQYVCAGEEAGETVEIWTDALQKALDEHEIVRIPAGVYRVDRPVIVRSNRHIECEEGAVIRLMEPCPLLLMRNEHAQDGTHAPIDRSVQDENISINGGRWEEWHRQRKGYGKSGMNDMERSFFGVSTCLYFGNVDHLTLTNMTFAHTAGFSVQVGDAKNVLFENITFESCYADGLHINGNTENIVARHISGQVGDDLVALNMYDWLNSSVNFGPMKTVLVEDIELSEDSRYKAIRIQPATYWYDDGSSVDCTVDDVIFKGVRGIKTFKMYFQTPRYVVGVEEPERGQVGRGDYIFFEDAEIDLNGPLDRMEPYMNSDPVTGAFGAFEICADYGHVSFENIRVRKYDHFPMSFLAVIGPKSVRVGEFEIFDPYVSCRTGEMQFKDVMVNGKKPENMADEVFCVRFDHLYPEAPSTGKGEVGQLIWLD